MPSGFGGVLTSGIQDVSALLPLLGTEQCEQHTSSALERGYIYAAATPMSIFGCLGIIKAALKASWAALSFRHFHGPTHLSNAGFEPHGVAKLLACSGKFSRDDMLHIAEENFVNTLPSQDIIIKKIEHNWL